MILPHYYGVFIGMKFAKPKFLKKLRLTKKRAIFLVIIGAILLGGFFFFRSRNKKDITTTTVQKGTVKEELILTGAIRAEKHAVLAFPTSGKIAWVGVSEGQKVYKGQALASLDKTVLNTAYQQALNTYKDKQASAEKAEDDVKDHASDETFAQKSTRTTAQVARDSAYDSVIAAEYNLRNATLIAPFSGIVASLPFPNPGINVSFSDTQVEILDPASIYFEVEADQTEVGSIEEGQEVTIVLDAFSDKEFKGKTTFVALTPKSGETSTVYKIKVQFSEANLSEISARIGMTGDARFTISQKENTLFAPTEFVNSDKAGRFVYLGKFGNRVGIEVGIEGEEETEIINGVKEGDVLYD